MPKHAVRILSLLLLVPGLAQGQKTEPAPNYKDHVQPLLRKHCLNCHNPDKARSDLDVSTYAKLMAGGQTLIPTLKQRLAQPSDIIDLGRVAELKGIKRDGDAVVIGAMTTHGEVTASDVVKNAIPGLAELAGMIGDPAVRNRGTLGGSICNNDPAADYPGAVVGLNATVRTTKRTIAGDDFFTGLFETAL